MKEYQQAVIIPPRQQFDNLEHAAEIMSYMRRFPICWKCFREQFGDGIATNGVMVMLGCRVKSLTVPIKKGQSYDVIHLIKHLYKLSGHSHLLWHKYIFMAFLEKLSFESYFFSMQ